MSACPFNNGSRPGGCGLGGASTRGSGRTIDVSMLPHVLGGGARGGVLGVEGTNRSH